MRLERIKLAGFKSFVDPTTVSFPSNLVGIVGPNGCGKSNVIDAVRWVMGESSAKTLRGESMADVIFNGSSSRKPVGTAGIELVFDNADGSAGGEYARFNQIAIKRQVARDGQSAYFLNGSRCRRRDIQDLFLGTGLGPRSYAIIEQGMVSRFIEARPEDLRQFIEEAAGISKYKERRRETENRMRHTRENLDRLEDLREEVAKQLKHLEKQAATAERYKRLKEEERQVDAELKALRWSTLDREIADYDAALGSGGVELEAGVARVRHLEADIEAKRDDYVAASDHFNDVQGRFYAVGAEIGRIEEAIRFAKEGRARDEAELARLGKESAAAEAHRGRDEETLAEVIAALETENPALDAAEAALAAALAGLADAEAGLEAWQAAWDTYNRSVQAPAEQAQVERARINHLEQTAGQDRMRLGRVDEELKRMSTAELEEQIEALEEEESALEEEARAAEEGYAAGERAAATSEQAIRELGTRLDAARAELHETQGRKASVVALQEAALGATDASLTDWLSEQGLDQAPRLAEHLRAAPGHERALEAALGGRLKAICTDRLDELARAMANLPGAITLFDTTWRADANASDAAGLAGALECPWPLSPMLADMRLAGNLEDALTARRALDPRHVQVTADGVLVGANWLSVPGSGETAEGVFARAEELAELERRIERLADEIEGLNDEQERLRDERGTLDAERESLRRRTAEINATLARTRADLSARRTRLEHQLERQGALEAERAELEERMDDSLAEIEDARERLHAALEENEALAERGASLSAERDALRAALDQARAAERDARERAHGLRVRVETHRATREATERTLERARAQAAELKLRGMELARAIDEAAEPLAEKEEQLEEQLQLRLEVEDELGDARRAMDELDSVVRSLEQERQRLEQEVKERQRKLDEIKLERQDRLVRRRTYEEQLADDGFAPQTLLESLDGTADEAVWQERLDKLGADIKRLGNINLAAIDEFAEQSERKQYLDEQHADVARSLETLEQAIRRIDRETRTRFKETYDKVNHGLQQLFPRLFGGGHAYLELTGEDLLETGVSIMARPPGKRNASIHLLSGGEKALTAVALVFAIFELNPAPFCMLDEVDAPLDDANVGRYCELVRSMSNQVQFIFITHNKVTMEIADQLLGVTMHEPGVSRIVSVDVDEATRLAAVS